jgi:tRNA (guanine-N7-)-methyltransferase
MTAHKSGDPTTLSRLYGRSKGHPLRAGPQALIDNMLPQISVPAEGAVTALGLFGEDCPLHFEIGFGGGEHLAYRANMLPNHGFIGAEPFLNGVASALAHVKEQHLPNVRIQHGDALDVLRRIPDESLRFVYLLHPDPWPKPRHAKRRMMNDGPVQMIANKLAPGGEFRFGTDHPNYLRHALMVMQRYTLGPDAPFTWLAEEPKAFLNRPGGWPETRYEAKAKAQGHDVWYFRYQRR